MTDSADRLKSLFLRAVDLTADEDRNAYLDGACADEADLRAEVEAMLRHHAQLGPFLETPLGDRTLTDEYVATATAGAEGVGTLVGPYKLLQQIGEGGMGVVFMAEQREPIRRRVALKVIKPGMDSAQVLARFEAERQALALMDHPGIARVFDAGTTAAGRPYFVMELVHGVAITKFCDDNALTVRERLELFVPVCQAIQHAHGKGVIHRDIKPGNVLVALYDGLPVPKVIDFGVAKATDRPLTERTMVTEFGTLIGTLEYMSPEQAQFNALDVDTRSDVYSLGVLLYELLTGSTPLQRKELRRGGYEALLHTVREVEPPRPSARLSGSGAALTVICRRRRTEPGKLAKLVRNDLDWIVMKALEKDRARRYDTASGLARDVERYLADEPVEACPPSPWYGLRRLARKHQRALAVAVGLVLVLAAGTALNAWKAKKYAQATAERVQAERDKAQQALPRLAARELESNLRQLEMLAIALESLLSYDNWRWDEAQIEHWMRAELVKDDRLFGMSLALDQKEYCMYVCRRSPAVLPATVMGLSASPHASTLLTAAGLYAIDDGIQKMYLHAPVSNYGYRNKDWFKVPKRDGVTRWSPLPETFEAGGSDDALIGYLIPLRWKGTDQVLGVLTVDLSITRFFKSKRLEGRLAELGLGRGGRRSYGFVISHTKAKWDGVTSPGTFLSHPCRQPEYRFPRTIKELDDVDQNFAHLADLMLAGKEGAGSAIDPWTGKQSNFLFAPLPSAEWTFVAVIEEAASSK